MITKRNIGTMAAIGGFTAAIALLSGLPSAKADELSDLRANQQLLQQRVDQLAQAGNVGAGSYLGQTSGGPVTVQMMGGSFPRSFLVPGTDTSIRVGGEAREYVGFWLNGSPPNTLHDNNPGATGDLNNIPLSNSGANATKGHSIFSQTPLQSKLNFETRTPTAWGEARTFIEFDFSNTSPLGTRPFAVSDNLGLRLRYAYGTLGGFLGGQANSNFSDSDAGLETISFSGLTGGPGHSRVPQLRYTTPLAGWGIPGALSFSAEQPETELWSPGTGTVGDSSAGAPVKAASPDLTAAWYIPQPWGHVDFSVVVRPTLQVKDGLKVDQTFVGYGGHFSGDVKPLWFGWDKDYIVWNVDAGEAIGPFMGAGSGNSTLGLVSNYTAALATNPANVLVKPVTAWGGNVGYRHQWTPNIRSNIGIGVYHEDIPGLNGAVCNGATGTSKFAVAATAARQAGTAGCGLNKEMVNAAASAFWSPVGFVDVGLEYMWGHRLTVGNQRGDENVIEGLFKVKF